MKISQLNCQSFLPKLLFLEQLMLTDWKCDVMCFCETWLSPLDMDNSLLIDGFSFFRRDRNNGSHGGLLVYVKSEYVPYIRRRTDLEHPEIECLTLEIDLFNKLKTLLFFCYRPPDLSPQFFFHTLSTLMATEENDTALMCIAGDFNAKHSLWNRESPENTAGTRLFEVMSQFGLTQCVQEPTRVSHDGSTWSVLDLFCINRPDLITSSCVSSPVSDHCCVTTTLSCRPNHLVETKLTLTFPDFDQADWPGLRSALATAPLFNAIQGTTNVNVSWAVWEALILEQVQRYIPVRTVTLRPGNKVWMTSFLHQLSRQKHRLFKIAKRVRTSQSWENYKKIRNECNTAFEKAKRAHIKKLTDSLDRNLLGSYHWWRTAKRITKLAPVKNVMPDLTGSTCKNNNNTDNIATTDSEKADLLARFFASQCSGGETVQNNCSAPYPLPEDYPSFSFPSISEEVVLRRLQHLPVFKATGDKMITNRVLRETAPFIAPSLTFIFNLSLRTSIFPEHWKTAIVCPLYKQRGDPSQPTNYRPVSLLHAAGKIMDALQSEALCRYLTKNSLISAHQFGFLPERSTTTQLVYLVDQWLKAMDNRQGVMAVFMDFMKAFDRVWHDGLIYKLAVLGVESQSLAWLKNYLSGRFIRVRVGSTLSEPYPIFTGVPQGSHLGPILFLVFINDLPDGLGVPVDIYADDTLLYKEVGTFSSASDMTSLQNAVTASSAWAELWHGRFGHAKTSLLRIGKTAISSTKQKTLVIENKSIKAVAVHKHLGVMLTESLKWSVHIESVISRGIKKAGLQRFMARDLPADLVSKLYLTYLRSVLEYASPVWHGGLSTSDELALEKIQASVARRVLSVPWMTPKSDMFKELDWPTLRWRRAVCSVVLLHKFLHSPSQPIAQCLFPFASDRSSRSLRKPKQLLLGHASSKRYLSSFFFHSSLLWNSLPASIQAIEKRNIFKRTLEDHWQQYKFDPYARFPPVLSSSL